MFTLRWLYDCLDYFCLSHRAAILDLMVSEALLERIFCHWEPSITHLLHMLLIYRFFDPSSSVQQTIFLQALGWLHKFAS